MRFPRGIRSESSQLHQFFAKLASANRPDPGQARYNCIQSVCSLFEKTMRVNNRLDRFFLRQIIEQFHQPRLVRIAHGRFATWLDPFGVLNPKVVVNLLSELRVSVDLTMQGRWLGGRFMCGAGRFV
jgi:hypothetical protein